MTPTQAVMAANDQITGQYGPCVMDDEDWADAFLAALPPGWRLCGPDDVTVTVDGLATAVGRLSHYDYETNDLVLRGTHRDAAAAILDALSADKEGQK